MPERVETIKCDCKNGVLEEVVKTEWNKEARGDSPLDPPAKSFRTVVYQCDACDEIYYQIETPDFPKHSPIEVRVTDACGNDITAAGNKPYWEEMYNCFRRYDGPLTITAIKQKLEGKFGYFPLEDL